MSEDLSLDRISTLRFRPSKEADDFIESYLRKSLIPGERYKSARLAIARSLHEAEPPAALERGTEMGGAIEGSHLFGEDKSLWACMIADAWPEPLTTAEAFKQAVEAHWHRGASLLKSDLVDARDDDVEFTLALSSRCSTGAAVNGARSQAGAATGTVRVALRVGEVSFDVKQNAPIDFIVNAPGASPHMALMGKIRSGKTRTGIEMARQLVESAQIPLLFIDPKGEFVRDGAFVPKSEWGGRTFADRFPGATPLDVGRTPVPLDFLPVAANMTANVAAQLAVGFRDSFRKCIRVKGDVALDNLREVVTALLQTNIALRESGMHKAVSLEAIRDAIHERNQQADRPKDSIEAKLGELADLNLFQPEMSPAEFFSRSWVVGLGATSEEAKRLVMFLLLDALATKVIGEQDAPTDSLGNRRLRHLLVVDEAREILSYRHGALSQLLRKAGSKGQVVMLLSQSPEDFDKEEDDFLSQMGTVVVFASSTQSVKSLRPVLGKKIQPEDLGDRELQRGVALVKLPNREPGKIIAWK
jgi:hypothetical protein